jgi:hypothetical protein
VILPTHSHYVGGDFYFERSNDGVSPAFYFYREVPLDEREALKKEDRRRLEIENVLSENRAEVLRDATVAFVVGGVIRRIQAKAAGQQPEKYSFQKGFPLVTHGTASAMGRSYDPYPTYPRPYIWQNGASG